MLNRRIFRQLVLCAASIASGLAAFVGILTATAAPLTLQNATPAIVSPEVSAAQNAFAWLRASQNADGSITSFGAPGTAAAIGDTAEAILAARSLGLAPGMVTATTGVSLLAPLNTITTSAYLAGGVARIGRFALALAAADLDPRAFNSYDLVISMTGYYSPSSGAFGVSNWDQSLAMLAWTASGETIPATATQLLASRIVSTDGGFEFSPGFGSDTNSTGLVLQALRAGGHAPTSTVVVSALQYLRNTQRSDGGWGYDGSSTQSDANSTAYVVQGLLAVNQDPLSAAWQIAGKTPISFLLSLQQPDGGIAYSTTVSNKLATVQAIPALLGKFAPYRSRAVALRKAREYIYAQHAPTGQYAGFGPGSTIDAMNALVAGGGGIYPPTITNTAALTYLLSQTAYPRNGPAAAGKYAVGVVLIGADPRNIGGLDLVLSMTNYLSATTGRYGSTVWDQSWTLLGQSAAGAPISATQVQQLISIAAPGGGYGFFANAAAADPDSTGLALMALRAAGVPKSDPAVASALAFLRNNWAANGAGTSPDSTGLAAQGLCAYGEDIRALAYGQVISGNHPSRLVFSTPFDALLDLQEPDGGFKTPFSKPVASYAGASGLACRPLPLVRFLPGSRIYLPVTARGNQ